jgi:hypothetical protein
MNGRREGDELKPIELLMVRSGRLICWKSSTWCLTAFNPDYEPKKSWERQQLVVAAARSRLGCWVLRLWRGKLLRSGGPAPGAGRA